MEIYYGKNIEVFNTDKRVMLFEVDPSPKMAMNMMSADQTRWDQIIMHEVHNE